MKLPGNLKISIEKSPPVRPRPPSPVMEIEPLILDEQSANQSVSSTPHDDLDIPQFMEKDSPVVSDIFQKPSPKKPRCRSPPIIQVVKDDTKKRKLTKKGKVRKEMTEEQKEKARENLRIAREKRALKQQGKQPKQVSFETEMVKPNTSGTSLGFAPVDAERAPQPQPSPAPSPSPAPAPPPPVSLFSKDDLEQSNLQAIIQYETLRKKRKEIKKNNKIVEDERQRVIGVAQQHIGGWQATAGRFNGCY